MESVFKVVTKMDQALSEQGHLLIETTRLPDWKKAMAKRRHDLSEALQTLSIGISQIKEGYRFDDPGAAVKIQYLVKSIGVIQREIEIVTKMYDISLNKPELG